MEAAMRRVGVVALSLVLAGTVAAAQERIEPLNVGVSAAAGLPSSVGAIRFGAPLGEHAGVDLAVGRLNSFGGMQTGPAYIAHVRWIRGGRAASGSSRYWIFGALGMHTTSSTLVIYPGDVRRYLVKDEMVMMPRFGYGWDQITRRGMRVGFELTTGAAGEQAGLMLANLFVTWGPPRR
jgi:hypothetical protein